ncbi:MAG: bifunctional riboflavin kinase/FAD synthetase [Cytophagales bacterium]|nr:bifunctional riboflavin kinase/FAD synthetase [Bernardetiaceae bacterium]MDW8209965.1 bifunctional riboflavin kinase/FAD synthetase [Cytophagales bacterium]
MKIQHGIAGHEPPLHAIVTEGTFDGVHLGHQKILAKLVADAQQARSTNPYAESVVVTFWPHPRLALFPDKKDLKLLTTLEEKTEILAAMGVDRLVVLPFDKSLSNLSPEEYVQKILITGLNTRKLIIGYDHRFGKNRAGDFQFLKAHENRFGFVVEEIPRQDVENIGVSSSRIRQALLQGDVETAAKYLGKYYSLSGSVTHGDKIGRTLGFPTANLHVSESYKLIPKDGIYAVRVTLRKQIYGGMLYIGVRSTLGNQLKRTVEVNIFNFYDEIYGETLRVELIAYLRGEETFDGLESMKLQLERDRETALKVLQRI